MDLGLGLGLGLVLGLGLGLYLAISLDQGVLNERSNNEGGLRLGWV